MFSEVSESSIERMTKCVCLNCRQNCNSAKGYFCLNGRFIPGVANTDTTVQAAAEDLRSKQGFDFGGCGRINDPTLVGAEFENPALSNESAFSNQMNYGNEQSTSSQDYGRNVKSNLLIALHSKQGHIQERTILNLNEPALFQRSTLNNLPCPGSSSQLNERNSAVDIDEKRFICHVCNKGFKRNQYLKEHRLIHDGIKPYECGICRKSFTQKSTLRDHIHTHTGEKPFSCKICGKTFTRKSYLGVHLRLHTNEKPFVCETCGKLFTRKDNLQAHALTHSDEKLFTCEICGKKFKTRSGLYYHMKNHE